MDQRDFLASNTNGFYLRAIARPTIPAQFRAIQGQWRAIPRKGIPIDPNFT